MAMEQSKEKSSSLVTARDWYVSNFKQFEKRLNGEASSHLHSIRKDAIARFADLGFPTTKDEEWKYTDVSPLTKVNFAHLFEQSSNGITKNDLAPFTFGDIQSHRFVCVNGTFAPELSSLGSLPKGVILKSLGEAIKSNSELVLAHFSKYAEYSTSTFVALNTAFFHDGVFLHVPKGMIIETPIYLLYISTKQEQFVVHPRNLILVDENAQVKIIESYVSLSDNVHFTNTVSELVMGMNSVVEHDRVMRESERAYHISTIQVQQERSSNFTSNAMTFGGNLVRNNVNVLLDGEGAECTLNGLYLGTGAQLIDNHTCIEHAKAHCPSHELYKGILSGKSKGVFNGKIKVRKDAQKTDAKQTNKNLVLSDEASIDTKPQLEIFADDVKCTHGATIGQLDDEALFYLRSRGISAEKAKDILIYAFASDIIDRVNVEPIRQFLHEIIHDRLEQERIK
jgi:Fe-S cluster assembly protein SufD